MNFSNLGSASARRLLQSTWSGVAGRPRRLGALSCGTTWTPSRPSICSSSSAPPSGCLYVLIVLRHDRWKIVHFDVSPHPTQYWLARQITEAFPWDRAPRYLLRDRDASYGQSFRERVRAMGIQEIVTAPRSPWQNAYVERVIGSIRRECLDHIIFSTHAIYAASCRHISPTTANLGRTCPLTRIAPTHAPYSR